MGSLSLFIKEETYASQFDAAFSRAQQLGKWEDFFENSSIILQKATDEKGKISYQGAVELVQFYYETLIKTTEDQ